MKFSLHVNNSLGKGAESVFKELTRAVMESASELDRRGVNFHSPAFQHTIFALSHELLTKHFDDKYEFEFFFMSRNDNLYFIVNSIADHPTLKTPIGMSLYVRYNTNANYH